MPEEGQRSVGPFLIGLHWELGQKMAEQVGSYDLCTKELGWDHVLKGLDGLLDWGWELESQEDHSH